MTCNKRYMWNPSTCACECDLWCKPGQYLDYKKCVCKIKLIGKIISECTSLFNETMMNDQTSIVNDDTTENIFIGLFSVLMFTGFVCFCIFAYFKWIKGKKLFKKNILIIKKNSSNYKMVIESLKIGTKSDYNWDDIVYVYDIDVKLIKVIKRESRIGVDIYYIGYVFDSEYETHSIKPLYLVVNYLFGHIEKIEGSSDRYLVVNINNINDKKIINVFDEIRKYIEQRITADGIWKFVEEKFLFDNENNEIKDYNKLRFSSNLDLPLNTLSKFRASTLTISCVIEKDGK